MQTSHHCITNIMLAFFKTTKDINKLLNDKVTYTGGLQGTIMIITWIENLNYELEAFFNKRIKEFGDQLLLRDLIKKQVDLTQFKKEVKNRDRVSRYQNSYDLKVLLDGFLFDKIKTEDTKITTTTTDSTTLDEANNSNTVNTIPYKYNEILTKHVKDESIKKKKKKKRKRKNKKKAKKNKDNSENATKNLKNFGSEIEIKNIPCIEGIISCTIVSEDVVYYVSFISNQKLYKYNLKTGKTT